MWCDPTDNAAADMLAMSQQHFKIDPQDLVKILGDIAEAIPEFSSFFQINLGSEEELQQVVTMAEQSLLTPAS